MTRWTSLIAWWLVIPGCATNPAHTDSPPSAPPRVLILGDSISIGYTPTVRKVLGEEAVVIRPMRSKGKAENCAGTTRGVEQIDRWIEIDDGGWDVIHFNFGLHDIKHEHPETGKTSNNPAHPHQASLPVYVTHLTTIASTIKATGATVIFATTTPVPSGRVSPYRDPADVCSYNNAAVEVMSALDIRVNDLHAFCLPRLGELQRSANVHFTPEGSRILGQVVAETIQESLGNAPRR